MFFILVMLHLCTFSTIGLHVVPVSGFLVAFGNIMIFTEVRLAFAFSFFLLIIHSVDIICRACFLMIVVGFVLANALIHIFIDGDTFASLPHFLVDIFYSVSVIHYFDLFVTCFLVLSFCDALLSKVIMNLLMGGDINLGLFVIMLKVHYVISIYLIIPCYFCC